MKNYNGERAWSILVGPDDEQYIILGYRHETNEAEIAHWKHPARHTSVMDHAPGMKMDRVVPVAELKKFKVLAAW